MKQSIYTTPSIEIIEVEIEDAVLQLSDVTNGGNYGDPQRVNDLF